MVPGAHVFLPAVTLFTAVRLCVCFLSAVHGVRGGGGAHWGVGQLADRPAVNREVGGSSPPAPVLDAARARLCAGPPCDSLHVPWNHRASARRLAVFGTPCGRSDSSSRSSSSRRRFLP